MRLKKATAALALFLASGCALFKEDAKPSASSVEAPKVQEKPEPLPVGELVEGYALLGTLMGEEKDVSKLLIIKRERAELHQLITRISRETKAAHEHLVALQGKNGFKRDGLPTTETAARKLISKHRAKELITEGGKEFELKMLLSQNEALTYGAALAEALAAREPDQKQSQWLRELARSISQLQLQVYDTLFKHYSWQKP